jgi:uncharacterized protein YndB with AHSA1/START domain
MQTVVGETNFDLSVPDTLKMDRVFRAPRKMVWSALTEPARLAEWYGPNGFRCETEVLDLRPGGEWTFTWVGPEGKRIPTRMVFVEIDPPARLVMAHFVAWQGDGETEQIQRVTTLDEVEGGTLLTLKMTFSSAEVRDQSLQRGGTEGGKQIMARLAEFLEKQQQEAA